MINAFSEFFHGEPYIGDSGEGFQLPYHDGSCRRFFLSSVRMYYLCRHEYYREKPCRPVRVGDEKTVIVCLFGKYMPISGC